MDDRVGSLQWLDRLAARYSREYDRPHAVVEAEAALLNEIRSAGLSVAGPERAGNRPYQRRYRVQPVGAVLEGLFDVPGLVIRIATRSVAADE